MGLIEKYGSGIQRVIEYFRRAGLPAPHFENISEGFMVTVYSGNKLGNKLGDKLGNKLGDKQKLILEFIRKNPQISLAQLSKNVKISQTAIENNIKKLKQKGILTRIGPAKGGHWEIINR
jgi:ATP-dependent DNA helicase RecG